LQINKIILTAHIKLAATFMPLLVRLVPFNRLLAQLTPPLWRRPYAGLSAEQIRSAVERCLRRPRNMRRRACLRKGLLLFHFLRLAGLPAELCFGVFAPRQNAERMHGHCWVTLNGAAMSDPPIESATVVLRHGGGAFAESLS